MIEIKTVDAVGHVLCHDMTRIINGGTKDVRFHKGHVVTEEDTPVMSSMGKETIFAWKKTSGMSDDRTPRAIKAMGRDTATYGSTVVPGGRVTAGELIISGYGGLCLNLPACTWLDCGFGKGM